MSSNLRRFTARVVTVATAFAIANGLGVPLAPRTAHAQRRPAAVTPATDPALGRLESEMTRLATIAGGKVGVAAIHLETGREVVLNRGEPFPMASTFKVPIAVQLLTRVDSGALRLDSMITIRPSDLHPGSGTLTQLFDDPGVTLSVRNLLELMLLISDNSATDIMLRTAGGSAPVNARLKALDVAGISVDRSTLHLIADAIGVKNLPPDAEVTPQVFRDLSRGVSSDAQKSAAEAFYRDRRDTATPDGMARLLETIWRGGALSKANTELLLDIMRRCETGPNRIKGFLPPDVVVRHKTGTLGIGVANDVGIIDLPNGAGHLVLAIFVKESPRSAELQERAIAQIARAAYDYFVFNPGAR
jgi:beta-lactamase class A